MESAGMNARIDPKFHQNNTLFTLQKRFWIVWPDVSNIYGVAAEKRDDFTAQDLEDSSELQDYNRNYHRELAKFNAADKDGNEKLDFKEYEAFYNPGKDKDQTKESFFHSFSRA